MKYIWAKLRYFFLSRKMKKSQHLDGRLRDAIRAGDIEAVRAVLAIGANPYGSCVLDHEGFHTPYELAVRAGNSEVMRLLSEKA